MSTGISSQPAGSSPIRAFALCLSASASTSTHARALSHGSQGFKCPSRGRSTADAAAVPAQTARLCPKLLSTRGCHSPEKRANPRTNTMAHGCSTYTSIEKPPHQPGAAALTSSSSENRKYMTAGRIRYMLSCFCQPRCRSVSASQSMSASETQSPGSARPTVHGRRLRPSRRKSGAKNRPFLV